MTASANATRWLPNYPGDAPDPRIHEGEQELWVRATALQALAREADPPPVRHHMRIRSTDLLHREIEAEVARVLPRAASDDRDPVIGFALVFADGIVAQTLEVNRRVLARAAVETAFDKVVRTRVMSSLTAAPPSAWWWGWGRDQQGRHLPVQLHDERGDNYQPAIVGHDIHRIADLPSQVDAAISTGTVAEVELDLRRTVTRWADCLRPPLSAIRLAADIIKNKDEHPQNILTLDLGHSVGPQALSGLFRNSKVWWDGAPVYGLPYNHGVRRPPRQAEVVVASIPALRLASFAMVATHPDGRLTRQVIDDHEPRATRFGTDHVESFAVHALARVRPGGVLVVLGDDEDGIHHQAVRLLAPFVEQGVLAAITIRGASGTRNTVTKPIWCPAASNSWRPGGVLAPTGRLVSAWTRRGLG